LALSRRRYQWLYLYGFVHPSSGDVRWWSLPTVSTEAFSLALKQFARDVGVGPKKHVLLVLDGAGWHTSLALKVPEYVHFAFLPPYSPELQPAERLWPLVNEVVANRPVETLDDLEYVVLERCLELRTQPDTIHGHTLFHWWHDAESVVA